MCLCSRKQLFSYYLRCGMTYIYALAALEIALQNRLTSNSQILCVWINGGSHHCPDPQSIFKIWQLMFFVFSFLYSLCILDMNPLSDIQLAKPPSPFCRPPLQCINNFLSSTKDFESHEGLMILGLISWLIRVLFRKSLPQPGF